MSRERSLLERFGDPDERRDRTTHEDVGRLADSVLANLSRLLNSHHGVCQIQSDYGLPAISDMVHNFPEAKARMRAAIKETIERYEPRLRRVRVKQAENTERSLNLHFEVVAELITPEEKTSVQFDTRIESDGKVFLRR